MNLLLQETALLIEQLRLLIELIPQGLLGHFEVVLDHYEGVLQLGVKDLHLFVDEDELLFGFGVARSTGHDGLLQVGL